jgi:dihydroorotase
MAILIKGGRVIDPAGGIDDSLDILVDRGRIKEIGKGLKASDGNGVDVIDAAGLIVAPGFIDMHVHLREPGFEYKEDIASGTAAAVAGGFTSVCPMPNTNPVNDNRSVTEYILRRASESGSCNVLPIGSITKGSGGTELSEMADMSDAGCVAFSDDGLPVADASVMRRALEYAKTFGLTLISHAEERSLSSGGVMNEGAMSTKLGLKGIPSSAEEVMTARDINLAGLTGGRLHIAHVSTKGAVELIRRAKADGINVTCETCPHYFTLTDELLHGYDTNLKVNPPIRTEEDRLAIIEGLRDGTIDAIATDHAPHAAYEKDVEFDLAPFGISGIETAVSLSIRLVEDGKLSLPELIGKMTVGPAKAIGIEAPSLAAGRTADITMIDTNMKYKVNAAELVSKGKNTAYHGMELVGRPVVTIVGGKVAYNIRKANG